MGSGNYYDPGIGRFLNRNAKPDQTNPYVPWGGNPTGALFTPLALLSLLYSRKKKRGTLDTIIILVVIGMSLGLSLTACGSNNGPTTTTVNTTTGPSTVTATPTPTWGYGNNLNTHTCGPSNPKPGPMPNGDDNLYAGTVNYAKWPQFRWRTSI